MTDIGEIYETLSQLKDNLSKYMDQIDKAKEVIKNELKHTTPVSRFRNDALLEELAKRHAQSMPLLFELGGYPVTHHRILIDGSMVEIAIRTLGKAGEQE